MTSSRLSDDPFRYCVYCGTDCYEDEPEHALDCPQVTGVWKVRAEDSMPCPHCGEPTRTSCCSDCGVELEVGDSFMYREMDTGRVVGGLPTIGEPLCVGCATATEITQ